MTAHRRIFRRRHFPLRETLERLADFAYLTAMVTLG